MGNVTEVVIKIPDEVFEAYKYWEEKGVATVEQMLITHGTVLPKGHGDLIDRDKLSPKIHGVKSIIEVLDAETIIEADKG